MTINPVNEGEDADLRSLSTDQIGSGHWRVGPDANGGNIQDTIDAANEGDLVVLEIGDGQTFETTEPIKIDKKLTLRGEGVGYEELNYRNFTGATIRVTDSATDGIKVTTGDDEKVDLHNLAVLFEGSHADTNTGHGFAIDPPADGNGHFEKSLFASQWSNLTVHRHDGDHYAFWLKNPIKCDFQFLRALGGGGIYLENDAETRHNGNLTFYNTHLSKVNAGSAAGHYYKATNETLNIITHMYPSLRRNAGSAKFVDYEVNNSGTDTDVNRIQYWMANMEGGQSNSEVNLPSAYRIYIPLFDAPDVTYSFERPWGPFPNMSGKFDLVDWYILDDFAGSSLSDRSGQYEASITTTSGNETATYRPDWKVKLGSPSIGSGYLSLPDGSGTAQSAKLNNNVNASSGTWSATFQIQSSVSSGLLTFMYQLNGFNNRYFVELWHDGSVNLTQADSGSQTTLSSGSYTVDTSDRRLEINHSKSGSISVLIDGVEIVSASDPYKPDPSDLIIKNELDSEVRIKQLEIAR